MANRYLILTLNNHSAIIVMLHQVTRKPQASKKQKKIFGFGLGEVNYYYYFFLRLAPIGALYKIISKINE